MIPRERTFPNVRREHGLRAIEIARKALAAQASTGWERASRIHGIGGLWLNLWAYLCVFEDDSQE